MLDLLRLVVEYCKNHVHDECDDEEDDAEPKRLPIPVENSLHAGVHQVHARKRHDDERIESEDFVPHMNIVLLGVGGGNRTHDLALMKRSL